MSFGLFVSILGVGASLFFAAVLLLRDRTLSPATLYLATVSLVQALALGDDIAEATNAYARAPQLYGLGYVLLPLFGPLIWLHVAALADPIDAGWRRARRHVVALALPWAPLVPFFLLPDRWQVTTGLRALRGADIPAFIGEAGAILLTTIQMGVYLVWTWLRAQGVAEPGRRRWVRGLVAAAAIAWIGFLIGLIGAFTGVAADAPLSVTNTILVAVVYGFAIYSLRSPPDPLTVPPAAGERRDAGAKYARSALSAEDGLRLMRRAQEQVDARAIHRDPMLTLARLASAVGASPNDMSQALNEHAGGFHAWLASVRVQDVERTLTADPGASLLDAAYAAGFNAKSTFYDAFRRSTGMSPAEWRAHRATTTAIK